MPTSRPVKTLATHHHLLPMPGKHGERGNSASTTKSCAPIRESLRNCRTAVEQVILMIADAISTSLKSMMMTHRQLRVG
jgi:hypothetical protein